MEPEADSLSEGASAPAHAGEGGLLSEVPSPDADPFGSPPESDAFSITQPSASGTPAFDDPFAQAAAESSLTGPSAGEPSPFGSSDGALEQGTAPPNAFPEAPSHGVAIGKLKLAPMLVPSAGVVEVSSGSTATQDPGANPKGVTAKKVSGLIANLAIAAGLVVVVATAFSIYRSEGKLEVSSLSPDRVKAMFSSSSALVPVDISNGMYDTQQGHPIFYVRGEVENRGVRTGKARVRAEIMDGSHMERDAAGSAGVTPSPEELYALTSAAEVEALMAQKDKAAVDVKPGTRAPFLLIFYEYPPDLASMRLRVSVTDEPASASR